MTQEEFEKLSDSEKFVVACDKLAQAVMDSLQTLKVPLEMQSAVLGGCQAEVIKKLPQEKQLQAFVHHVMSMRMACGFENEIGVLPIAMEEKNSNDGLTDDERKATRH